MPYSRFKVDSITSASTKVSRRCSASASDTDPGSSPHSHINARWRDLGTGMRSAAPAPFGAAAAEGFSYFVDFRCQRVRVRAPRRPQWFQSVRQRDARRPQPLMEPAERAADVEMSPP